MCQDDNSARDGDNSDESSDEELFNLLVDDDDREFMDHYYMIDFAWRCTLINGGGHKIQSPQKMLDD